jgi:hypothetical protein
MASTLTENVAVTELSKYGVKVGNEYYNWSKQIKESDKGKVVPGGTYAMDLYVADSGKRYINSVNGEILVPKEVTHPQVKVETSVKAVDVGRAKKYTPKAEVSAGLSKDEWAAKDRRISRQGCIQVAVQVAGTFEEAVVLADKMLTFVQG